MTDTTNRSLVLPRTSDEVTPDWLSRALSIRYPKVKVTSVVKGIPLSGTATKIRLLLDYNDQGHAFGLPPTMIVKGGLSEYQYAEMLSVAYRRETIFYRDIGPRLAINLPECYFAGIDLDTGQGLLLLEDLLAKNVTFGLGTRPLTPEKAAAILDLLASLHGVWWNSSELDTLEQFPGSMAELMPTMLFNPQHWADCMARPRAAGLPAELRDPICVEEALRAMWRIDQEGPHCIIHGDAHLGNVYFERAGAPGFIDWQFVMRGSWAFDFTYFLIGALDIEDRRKHERDLLTRYLEKLAQGGVTAPDLDQAWLAYRQHVIHGFMWVANPEEQQPEEISKANAERYAAAMADLETLESLGVS